MFAGITNLLWGSSAPAAAPEVPAPLEDELCPMDIGSDTACSDEEMVHLPKPNSDGEEDWVVVTEGRSGKKEAPKKKKQVDVLMDLDAKIEGNNVLKFGEKLVLEVPRKNKQSAKVLRRESKTKNREPKAWNVETQQVSPTPKLFSTVVKKAVKTDDEVMRAELKSAVEDTHANMPVEPAIVDVEPKLAKVEKKMENMNLSRMRVEQKRGRVESKLTNTDAKRAKGEPKVFEAKTDIVKTETEMVQEVDVKRPPKRESVQPKLVTDELKLVKAEPQIVPAKPEIVVETKPEPLETRSRAAKEGIESNSALEEEEVAKERSERDDTGFKVVHSRHHRYNSAKTRKEVKALNHRQSEQANIETARAVPDEIRIESKMDTEEAPANVESEKAMRIESKMITEESPSKVEFEEVMRIDSKIITNEAPAKVESEKVMRIESKVITKRTLGNAKSQEVKVDVINHKTGTAPGVLQNRVDMSETEVPSKLPKYFPASLTTKLRRQRRTRVKAPAIDRTFEECVMGESLPASETRENFFTATLALMKNDKRSLKKSLDDLLDRDGDMVVDMIKQRSQQRPIDEDIRELLEYAGLDKKVPRLCKPPFQSRSSFEDKSKSASNEKNGGNTVWKTFKDGRSFAVPFYYLSPWPEVPQYTEKRQAAVPDHTDLDVELLCNMLNDKDRIPSEIAGLRHLLRGKLEERRVELEKELESTKQHEAKVADQMLKKEVAKQEMRLTRQAVQPVEHRRLSRKSIQKSNAARHMLSVGNGRLRRSDRLQPRQSSGANNSRKCC